MISRSLSIINHGIRRQGNDYIHIINIIITIITNNITIIIIGKITNTRYASSLVTKFNDSCESLSMREAVRYVAKNRKWTAGEIKVIIIIFIMILSI